MYEEDLEKIRGRQYSVGVLFPSSSIGRCFNLYYQVIGGLTRAGDSSSPSMQTLGGWWLSHRVRQLDPLAPSGDRSSWDSMYLNASQVSSTFLLHTYLSQIPNQNSQYL